MTLDEAARSGYRALVSGGMEALGEAELTALEEAIKQRREELRSRSSFSKTFKEIFELALEVHNHNKELRKMREIDHERLAEKRADEISAYEDTVYERWENLGLDKQMEIIDNLKDDFEEGLDEPWENFRSWLEKEASHNERLDQLRELGESFYEIDQKYLT